MSSYSVPQPVRVQTYAGGVETVLELDATWQPETAEHKELARALEAAGLITETKRGKASKAEPDTEKES